MPEAKVALTGRTNGPLLQKPLPRDLSRVKHFIYFGSHRGIDHAGRPV